MIVVIGKDSTAQRTVQVTAVGKGDGTTVGLTFESKK
jgi:hypothetical protein